jgi:hypothetical protein
MAAGQTPLSRVSDNNRFYPVLSGWRTGIFNLPDNQPNSQADCQATFGTSGKTSLISAPRPWDAHGMIIGRSGEKVGGTGDD